MKNKVKFLLLTIVLTLLVVGCNDVELTDEEKDAIYYKSDDWNNGHCPIDNGRYYYQKLSGNFYYYKCDICGNEIRTTTINKIEE